jgi:iron complex outermembrane receptor protein
MSFDLPEGKAIETLRKAALQGEIQILFSDSVVDGVMTKAIRGQYAPREALVLMLKGTGLGIAQANTNGAYAITLAENENEVSGSNDITTTTQSYSENKIETEMNAKKNNWLKTLAAALTIGIVGGPGWVAAQEDAEDTYTLNAFEVESTSDVGYRARDSLSGTRVSMDLFDIPQSISIVTEELMKDFNLFDTDEAARVDASVSKRGFFANQFVVRGFVSGNTRKNGLEIDTQSFLDRVNVSRIEVVKGPAAVLYGVGSPGGVVNVISKQPLPVKQGSVRSSIGDGSFYRAELDWNSPLNEEGTFLGRVTAAWGSFDSSLEFGDRETISINPSFSWLITPNTKLTYIFEYQYSPDQVFTNERLPVRRALVPTPTATDPDSMSLGAVAFVTGFPQGNRLNIAGPDAVRTDSIRYNYANLVHSFSDDLTLRLNGVYMDYDQARITQFTAFCDEATDEACVDSLIPIQSHFVDRPATTKNFQADLLWDYSLSDDKVNGQIILGWRYDWNKQHRSIWRGRAGTNIFGDPVPGRGRVSFSNPTRETYDLRPFPELWIPWVTEDTSSEDAAQWVIGTAQFLDDRLVFMGGWRRDQTQNSTFFREDNRPFGGRPGADTTSGKSDALNNYQYGITYDITPQVTGYVSFTESGQLNDRFPDNPQQGEGWEAGIRWDVNEGRFGGAVNIFDMKLKDIQRFNPLSSFDPSIPDFALSGSEGNDGIEIELWLQLTDGFRLMANFIDQNPVVLSSDEAPYLEGQTIENAFENEFNLFARYEFSEGPATGLFVKAGVQYRSDVRPYGGNATLWRLVNDSYTLFDFGAGYSWEENGREKWRFEVDIKNATDETYFDWQRYGELRRVIGTLSCFW